MNEHGTKGERLAQERFGTQRRALAFYDKQMLDHLNVEMQDFIAEQTMFFIASADANGECDCSFRAGEAGFAHVLNSKTLFYPEYGGNGVMASIGNILENPHIGLTFVDFFVHTIGLHVNGSAQVVSTADMARLVGGVSLSQGVRTPERWVVLSVDEAYIHCSKNIPQLKRVNDPLEAPMRRSAGDFFKAKSSKGRQAGSQTRS